MDNNPWDSPEGLKDDHSFKPTEQNNDGLLELVPPPSLSLDPVFGASLPPQDAALDHFQWESQASQNTPQSDHRQSFAASEASENAEFADNSSSKSSRLMTKSQKIGHLQNVFTDAQKIAYAGLCYVLSISYKLERLMKLKNKKPLSSYEKWMDSWMEVLFTYLDLAHEERRMICRLAEHGLQPSDMSHTLIADAHEAAKKAKAQQATMQSQYFKEDSFTSGFNGSSLDRRSSSSQRLSSLPSPTKVNTDNRTLGSSALTSTETISELTDIRYTILSHFFMLSIIEGVYDSRSRTLLTHMAKELQVPYMDLIQLEKTITEQLRIVQDSDELKKDQQLVGTRNKKDNRGRWALTAAATLAGGAVIGLTAGLATPLIGAGIGAALAGLGVSGAAGVGSFMVSTAGVAIITTGGALTGGGMFGKTMVKRTRGIEEFEFIPIFRALIKLEENRRKRKKARRKRWRIEAKAAQEQKEIEAQMAKDPDFQPPKANSPKKEEKGPSSFSSFLWKSKDKKPKEASSASGANHSRTTTAGTDTSLLTDLSTVEERSRESTVSLADGSDDMMSEYPTSDPRNNSLDAEQQGHSKEHISGSSPARSAKDVAPDTTVSSVDGLDSSEQMASEDGDDLKFKDNYGKSKQINVVITIAGWLAYGEDDFTLPFANLKSETYGDHYVLRWESETLQRLGSALAMLASEVTSFIVSQSLQATLLPLLMAGLSGPMWALKLTYLLDNPWGNGLTQAKRAGRVLADNLIAQIQDHRPVTLIGFSLGARVIYYCLEELAKRNAYGIIEDVYMLGAPVMANRSEWQTISAVISGKIVNGYLNNDWVLGFLYRASTASWSEVAGLHPIVGVPGVENVVLDDVITGHLEYRLAMPKILEKLGFETSKVHFADEDEEEQQDNKEKDAYLAKLGFPPEEKTDLPGEEGVDMQEWAPRELPSTMPVLVLHEDDERMDQGDDGEKKEDVI